MPRSRRTSRPTPTSLPADRPAIPPGPSECGGSRSHPGRIDHASPALRPGDRERGGSRPYPGRIHHTSGAGGSCAAALRPDHPSVVDLAHIPAGSTTHRERAVPARPPSVRTIHRGVNDRERGGSRPHAGRIHHTSLAPRSDLASVVDLARILAGSTTHRPPFVRAIRAWWISPTCRPDPPRIGSGRFRGDRPPRRDRPPRGGRPPRGDRPPRRQRSGRARPQR